MTNSMPKEAYLVPTSVPMRASGTATVPLAQNVTVGDMPSPPQSGPATPILSVPDNRRERPTNVSQPSGRTSGYPANTNAPATVPGSNGFPRREQ